MSCVVRHLSVVWTTAASQAGWLNVHSYKCSLCPVYECTGSGARVVEVDVRQRQRETASVNVAALRELFEALNVDSTGN